MNKRGFALAVIALAALCRPAGAQTPCAELNRLYSEAAEAETLARGAAAHRSCQAYGRFVAAWGAIFQYASDHRPLCDISNLSLEEIEKQRHKAETARSNVCAGRPARPFPPDIIRQ